MTTLRSARRHTTKTPATLPLTDREIAEGEEEAARVRQDIHAANLALAQAIDKAVTDHHSRRDY